MDSIDRYIYPFKSWRIYSSDQTSKIFIPEAFIVTHLWHLLLVGLCGSYTVKTQASAGYRNFSLRSK